MAESITQQTGFTLIELVLVVAIVGILAAMAYPSYQQYVIRTKRADMMAYLQTEASRLEGQRLAMGSWSSINTPSSNYPLGNTGSKVLYSLSGTLDANGDGTTGDWKITAEPNTTGMMRNDGVLSIDASGRKCRKTVCGLADEWRIE